MDAPAELVAATGVNAEMVVGWAADSPHSLAWLGDRTGTAADIFRGWGANDVRQWMLVVDGIDVGYGELWDDAEENETELAHLVVAPDRRGQGHGRALIRLLTLACPPQRRPILRVEPANTPAIACYLAAGWHRLGEDEQVLFNAGQPREYLWMEQSPGR